MSSIQAVASTSNTALSGLNRAIQNLDTVAQSVAEGIKSTTQDDGGTFTEKIGALAQIPMISTQARANAKVIDTVSDLNAEFLSLPRR